MKGRRFSEEQIIGILREAEEGLPHLAPLRAAPGSAPRVRPAQAVAGRIACG